MEKEIKDQLKIILDKLTSIELDQAFLIRKILEPNIIPTPKFGMDFGYKNPSSVIQWRQPDIEAMDAALQEHTEREAEKLNIFPRVHICKNGDRKVAVNTESLNKLISEENEWPRTFYGRTSKWICRNQEELDEAIKTDK